MARTIIALLCALALAAHALAAGEADRHWVHGSWVNLHAEASHQSRVIAHLTANSSVSMIERRADWCEVIAEATDTRGFVSCKLLGERSLDLAVVGSTSTPSGEPHPDYSATRAFWLAPSVSRLQAAGAYFWQITTTDRQRANESYLDSGDTPQFDVANPPKIVRRAIPQFDAMKALLARGVVAPPEMRPEMPKWTGGLASGAMHGSLLNGVALTPERIELGSLNAVKPSLFKSPREFAPAYSNVEQLSAQFDIPERMRVLEGAKWVWPKHDLPYVGGIWDVGAYELSLARPVVEYVLGRGGLIGASVWNAVEHVDVGIDVFCVGSFAVPRGTTPLADYPVVKDPLVWLYLPRALPYRKGQVKTSVRRATSGGAALESGRGILTTMVTYEFDLDADGIADVAVWEGNANLREVGDTSVLKLTFVNVAGAWHHVNSEEVYECT